MFKNDDYIYYQIGDVVQQNVYPDVTGEVIECLYQYENIPGYCYRLSIVLPIGHPDAFDENGDPQYAKVIFQRDTDLMMIA